MDYQDLECGYALIVKDQHKSMRERKSWSEKDLTKCFGEKDLNLNSSLSLVIFLSFGILEKICLK